MSNIIVFPKSKRDGTPPQSIEELIESVESVRKEHIEYIINECCSFLFSRIGDEGFDICDEECTKSTALVVESLRATLYNAVGIDHPLHQLAEKMFTMDSLMEPDVEKMIEETEAVVE